MTKPNNKPSELNFDNRTAQVLFGPQNENITRLENLTNTQINTNGNHVRISGDQANVTKAQNILTKLANRARRGEDVSVEIVDAEVRLYNNEVFDHNGGGKAAIARSQQRQLGGIHRLSPSEHDDRPGIKLRGKFIEARTRTQIEYVQALQSHEWVFGVGPAGTGKTYLAVARAVQLFQANEVDKIIITRPAVEAGEKLGFLPGDQKEKVDPYMIPIYDALRDFLGGQEKIEAMIAAKTLEIAPIAFMRGRTLHRAAVVADETQNLTVMQMKMLLTRPGDGTHLFVTGDPDQVDLPPNQQSGLRHALDKVVPGITEIAKVAFNPDDVVRHPIVGKVLKAYDAARNEEAAPRPQGV